MFFQGRYEIETSEVFYKFFREIEIFSFITFILQSLLQKLPLLKFQVFFSDQTQFYVFALLLELIEKHRTLRLQT